MLKYFVALNLLIVFISCGNQPENSESDKELTEVAAETPVNPPESIQESTKDPFAIPQANDYLTHDHDHDHDHGDDEPHSINNGEEPFVIPRELAQAMEDSGSYNVDMTKTQRWTEYTAQFRDSEKGPATDTVFVKSSGFYEKDHRNGLWTFSISRDRKLPLRWTLAEEVEFKDGIPHGRKTIYQNKRIFLVEHYKDGVLDGPAYYYDEFGELVMEANYRNNMKHGLLKKFAGENRLLSTAEFSQDVQMGKYENYYPNGKLKELGFSKAGKPDGTWKLFHPNGQLWTEREYKDGKAWRVLSNFTSEGNVRPAGTLQGGDGTILLYDDAGNLAETETYRNGILVQP